MLVYLKLILLLYFRSSNLEDSSSTIIYISFIKRKRISDIPEIGKNGTIEFFKSNLYSLTLYSFYIDLIRPASFCCKLHLQNYVLMLTLSHQSSSL